jgi:NADP-dependent 3-hydroxy acid dehydrogenase YdfG
MAESARQELNETGVRVTLIEPDKVDTTLFFDNPVSDGLEPATSPARSCTPSSSRRTSTSTRS